MAQLNFDCCIYAAFMSNYVHTMAYAILCCLSVHMSECLSHLSFMYCMEIFWEQVNLSS